MGDDFEKAQDEWDMVAEIVPSVQHEAGVELGTRKEAVYQETPLATIEEVLRDFRERYLERLIACEDEAIPLRDGRSRLSRLRSFLQCPTNLCYSQFPGQLSDEKEEIMAASRCPFDDDNPLHFAVLLTIYKQLVSTSEEGEGLHSTEVALTLLTQRPWVQITALLLSSWTVEIEI